MVVLLTAGAAAALLLAPQQPVLHALATPLMFATGWAWPGLFNLAVVQARADRPGAATGVTQTGTYLGAVTRTAGLRCTGRDDRLLCDRMGLRRRLGIVRRPS